MHTVVAFVILSSGPGGSNWPTRNLILKRLVTRSSMRAGVMSEALIAAIVWLGLTTAGSRGAVSRMGSRQQDGQSRRNMEDRSNQSKAGSATAEGQSVHSLLPQSLSMPAVSTSRTVSSGLAV